MKNGRQIKIRYFVAFLSFLVSAIKIAVLASPSPVLSPAGARLLGQLCDTVSASVVGRRLAQPGAIMPRLVARLGSSLGNVPPQRPVAA